MSLALIEAADMRLAAPANKNQQLDWETWTPSTKIGEIMADPEKAAKEYVAAVPQHAGKEKAMEAIMRRYVAQVYAPAAGFKLGQFDKARMEKVQKFYVDSQIVEKAVPIEETFTNQFVQ